MVRKNPKWIWLTPAKITRLFEQMLTMLGGIAILHLVSVHSFLLLVRGEWGTDVGAPLEY
ncbi:MAG: hypothetical protein G01um101438_989 [Parcubacteria group bacterium Gr01-1014_38]|nr:MAG: hypothetical protein G01um101438_989 [Parcubacteria group bacterium Gr01-1014_38]